MELFIQIVDGKPFEHPIFGDNFRQAFPDIDIDNLPAEFARFERVEQNVVPSVFEVAEVSYQLIDGIVKDVWTIRSMTSEEKLKKRQELTDGANATVELMKELAQQNSNNAPSNSAKEAWISYLSELNAWVLVDPLNPNLPKPPLINSDGTVMSITAAGTEPNVIG